MKQAIKIRRIIKLLNYRKNLKTFALIFILSALVITTAAPNIASVKAQGPSQHYMLTAAGGTTDPAMGHN